MASLFESLLYESKDRFIDKAFAAAYGDGGIDEDYVDAVKKFANSSAADKSKLMRSIRNTAEVHVWDSKRSKTVDLDP